MKTVYVKKLPVGVKIFLSRKGFQTKITSGKFKELIQQKHNLEIPEESSRTPFIGPNGTVTKQARCRAIKLILGRNDEVMALETQWN